MSKQLTKASSTEVSKSTTLLPGVILREQKDKDEALSIIAKLLERISMLWQIPNWSVQNSVLLAEWIFETYPCEPLEVIIACLKNPVPDEEKTYRLTPDIIKKWMVSHLEASAAKLETENLKLKEAFKEPLDKVDYESFKKRIAEGTALKDPKPKNWADDESYKAFKAERFKNQMKK